MPTPCESWPLRLASTRLSATVRASSALLPAGGDDASDLGAVSFGIG